MISFNLNGKPVSVDDADGDTPLLWIVRDKMGLKGTKFGCGIAMCGVCTVHVDGKAARSCVTPVRKIAGRSITTIEGLDAEGNHPVQQAWNEIKVPQCGYCQSGQIMQAAALLSVRPQPTDQDINTIMFGNFCRCMTYPRIREAIHKAAEITAKGSTKG